MVTKREPKGSGYFPNEVERKPQNRREVYSQVKGSIHHSTEDRGTMQHATPSHNGSKSKDA